ncbi:hypothetical protein AAG906_001072 [Vitis piasezkii]
MASYGFLLYGPGSYAWCQYLDRALPEQTVENLLLKVCSVHLLLLLFFFTWNNIWLGKLSELPNKYQKDLSCPWALYSGTSACLQLWANNVLLRSFVMA